MDDLVVKDPSGGVAVIYQCKDGGFRKKGAQNLKHPFGSPELIQIFVNKSNFHLDSGLIGKHFEYGLKNYLEIHPDGPMFYVVGIQGNLLFERQIRTAGNLGDACCSGFYGQSPLVMFLIPLDLVRLMRPRADQAYVTE